MSRILVIGGGGMVGQKLAQRIAGGALGDAASHDVTLFDMAFPDKSAPGQQMRGTLTDASILKRLAAHRYDTVFHLAAIVSGEAEIDYDKGWSVNMMSMWQLLEALREEHTLSDGEYRPRVVFTSSIAVFGGPYPEKISDTFLSAPQTSYGAQKAASELMLSDASRKGYVDGLSLRLPTICVRPGKANLAASSFFSGIIREPLNGQEALLPVPDTVRHWHASPRSAAGFLTHAATLDTNLLEGRRALNLPGLSCTVAEQIEALRKVSGEDVVRLIKSEPDENIMRIVGGWPRNFYPERAIALGFQAESSFEDIIRVYIADDL
ncbi:MAG: D-erythronate dehydrogenase [Pseudomonadota bacterium]